MWAAAWLLTARWCDRWPCRLDRQPDSSWLCSWVAPDRQLRSLLRGAERGRERHTATACRSWRPTADHRLHASAASLGDGDRTAGIGAIGTAALATVHHLCDCSIVGRNNERTDSGQASVAWWGWASLVLLIAMVVQIRRWPSSSRGFAQLFDADCRLPATRSVCGAAFRRFYTMPRTYNDRRNTWPVAGLACIHHLYSICSFFILRLIIALTAACRSQLILC